MSKFFLKVGCDAAKCDAKDAIKATLRQVNRLNRRLRTSLMLCTLLSGSICYSLNAFAQGDENGCAGNPFRPNFFSVNLNLKFL